MVLYERSISLVAAEAITAGNLLYLDDNGKAAKCTASAATCRRFIGAAATSESAAAYVAAVQGQMSLVSGAAINYGDKVVVDPASGQKVIAFSAATHDADQIIGFAVSKVTGADAAINVFVF